MIQIQAIRNRTEEVIERLSLRGIHARPIIEELVQLDEEARNARLLMEQQQARSNQLAKEIGDLYKRGKKEEADKLKLEATQLKDSLKELEELVPQKEEQLKEKLLQVPNTPSYKVPKGTSAEDNEIVHVEGHPPLLKNNALPHWELAHKYQLIDFELGTKIAGSGFPVYKGKGARLQRALINFFLDEAMKQGYYEIQPPIVVNADSGYGTGQLPDKEGQMYHIPLDELYLIPTAEVPITNLYRDVILSEAELPIKNVGYTPCFRREAGSYGAHVRGLNRLHQFDKVEIVQIAHPQQSYEVLEEMSLYVQSLLRKLGLHFRVLRLCGGDMGFTSSLTYDMEVYSAAQERWLEVSSVSCFETFQSNRLKLRFRNTEGKTELCHTLNGSALALPRIVAALLENNQSDKGIAIPEVLWNYTGFQIIN